MKTIRIKDNEICPKMCFPASEAWIDNLFKNMVLTSDKSSEYIRGIVTELENALKEFKEEKTFYSNEYYKYEKELAHTKVYEIKVRLKDERTFAFHKVSMLETKIKGIESNIKYIRGKYLEGGVS